MKIRILYNVCVILYNWFLKVEEVLWDRCSDVFDLI